MRIGLAACVLRSMEVLPIARHAGFDFLLVDMEHGAFSLGEAAALCVAGREAGFPVHVRAPGARSELLSRIVESGAATLVVPRVESADEARFVVERVRFAPRGARSVPPPVGATGFRPMPAAELVEVAERGLEVLVMIESGRGLAAVDEIAAVAGVDGLVVGMNDLAASLGLLERPGAPELVDAVAEIAQAASQRNLRFGAMGMSEATMRAQATGLRTDWLVAANDVNLLFDAGRDLLSRLRASAGPRKDLRWTS